MTSPDPHLEQAVHLDELAARMIMEATSITSPNVLSATGFARENISIVHQQRRTTNLAWALSRTGRVGAGKVVGIVGASFSGLMLAVILAMVDDAIVHLFEKENEILPRFRDKAHRHLSTVLNSRSLGKRFDPESSSAEYRSPVFAWRNGRASDVAACWANEFDELANQLPIFVFTGDEISADMVLPRPDGVDIWLANVEPDRAVISLDVLIDATGYGEEGNPLGLADYSYWESGHRLIYDHLATPAKVLISGCGDSGVIEALHYAIDQFRHRYVTALWNPYSGLDAQIDVGLPGARLDAILNSGEAAQRYEVELISEIVWWRDQRDLIVRNPNIPWPYSSQLYGKPIFDRLEALLKPHYEASGRIEPFEMADPDDLEGFIEELSLETQLTIRDGVRGLAEEWVSREMERLALSIPLPDNFEDMTDEARPNVEVVLNGIAPTAYTRQLSPYNVWIMRVLLAFPSVTYLQGRIAKVTQRPDKRFDVAFEDGTVDTFDRVVSRYGPAARGSAPIAEGRRRNTQESDWLLASERILAADPSDSARLKYTDPQRAGVANALDALEKRARTSDTISKRKYVTRLKLGETDVDKDDPIYSDPQNWLSAQLASGSHPQFDSDLKVDRRVTRR